jgi:hypothetical protein
MKFQVDMKELVSVLYQVLLSNFFSWIIFFCLLSIMLSILSVVCSFWIKISLEFEFLLTQLSQVHKSSHHDSREKQSRKETEFQIYSFTLIILSNINFTWEFVLSKMDRVSEWMREREGERERERVIIFGKSFYYTRKKQEEIHVEFL